MISKSDIVEFLYAIVYDTLTASETMEEEDLQDLASLVDDFATILENSVVSNK